jgi:hypothetical protein
MCFPKCGLWFSNHLDIKVGVLVCIYNPSYLEGRRQEDLEVEVCPGKLAKPYLRKKIPG